MWKQGDKLDEQAITCTENKILFYHNKNGKIWINFVCVLTVEPTGYPEKLGVGLGKIEELRIILHLLFLFLVCSFFIFAGFFCLFVFI